MRRWPSWLLIPPTPVYDSRSLTSPRSITMVHNYNTAVSDYVDVCSHLDKWSGPKALPLGGYNGVYLHCKTRAADI